MSETSVEIGGKKVNVLIEGKGKPLLFFYDQWHTSWGLVPLLEELRYRFRVYGVNPPGFGGSTLTDEFARTTKEYAAFLGEALQSVAGGRVILVLHDIGVPIGIEALAEGYAPLDHLDGVVIMNGPVYEAQQPNSFSMRPSPFLRSRDLPTDRIAHRRRILRLSGEPGRLDEGLTEACWDYYIKGFLRDQVKLGLDIDQSLTASATRLQTISETGIPLLVLWGEEDPLGGKEIAQRLGEDLPNAEGFLLPEVGHFPHVEAPRAVAEELWAFVSRSRPVPTSNGDAVSSPPPDESK